MIFLYCSCPMRDLLVTIMPHNNIFHYRRLVCDHEKWSSSQRIQCRQSITITLMLAGHSTTQKTHTPSCRGQPQPTSLKLSLIFSSPHVDRRLYQASILHLEEPYRAITFRYTCTLLRNPLLPYHSSCFPCIDGKETDGQTGGRRDGREPSVRDV
jgi:hypothetical protein